MTRREAMARIVVGAVLPLLGEGCNLFYTSSTVRYRMTVDVSTPQGLKTGSSVIETTIQAGPKLGTSGISYKTRGEAVAVDLPGGTLFALLTSKASGYDYPAHLLDDALRNGVADRALNRSYQSYDWKAEREDANQVKPTITLASVDYPTMVRFREVSDPKTIELVDPDALEASFVSNVQLRRISIQVTDDAVTHGIAERLKWLPSQHGQILSSTLGAPLAEPQLADITEGDFHRGMGYE